MNQKLVILIAGVVLLAAVIVIPKLLVPDNNKLKQSLAKQFQVPEDFIYLNIPPANGRYPGAIFLHDHTIIPIEFAQKDDQKLVRGSVVNITLDATAEANSGGSLRMGFLGQLVESGRTKVLKVSIAEVRMVEMRGEDIKQALLNSQSAKNASMQNQPVYIVTRAYEGVITVNLSAKNSSTAEVMADDIARSIPNSEVKVQGASNNDDMVTVQFATPTVFAFEVQKANYIMTHLGLEPNDVRLTPVNSEELPIDNAQDKTDSLAIKSPKWQLAVISSGYYPFFSNAKQPWNAYCAKTVTECLSLYHPTKVVKMEATRENPLSASKVMRFADDLLQQGSKSNLDLLVVYYIGHMMTKENEDIVLMQGEAKAYDTNFSEEGFLHLIDLYHALENNSFPFVLLVDGCLPSTQFESFRQSLGFDLMDGSSQMIYLGPEEIITNELTDFADGLRNYANRHTYLKESNPVILAAKPGTVAKGYNDPKFFFGPYHAPIAEKIRRLSMLSVGEAYPPSLVQFLKSLASFRGVGEISATGSISWSDFEVLDKIRVSPAKTLTVTPLNREPFDGISTLSSNGDTYWVKDWNGEIWTWKPSTDVRSIYAHEVPFNHVAAVDEHTVLRYEGFENTLYEVNEGGEGESILENVSVEFIKGYPQRNTLIVEQDGDIDSPDRILLFQDERLKRFDSFETGEIFDMILDEEGNLYYSLPTRELVVIKHDEIEQPFAVGLKSPGMLGLSNKFLYILSQDEDFLYRVSKERKIEMTDLSKVINLDFPSSADSRTFIVHNDSKLIVAAKGYIYSLDANYLDWQEIYDSGNT